MSTTDALAAVAIAVSILGWLATYLNQTASNNEQTALQKKLQEEVEELKERFSLAREVRQLTIPKKLDDLNIISGWYETGFVHSHGGFDPKLDIHEWATESRKVEAIVLKYQAEQTMYLGIDPDDFVRAVRGPSYASGDRLYFEPDREEVRKLYHEAMSGIRYATNGLFGIQN